MGEFKLKKIPHPEFMNETLGPAVRMPYIEYRLLCLYLLREIPFHIPEPAKNASSIRHLEFRGYVKLFIKGVV